MPADQKTYPAHYEIQVAGRLNPERAAWFGEMALTFRNTPNGTAITTLRGPVADRAALFGILNRVRDLGLRLISVNPVTLDLGNTVGGEMHQEDGR